MQAESSQISECPFSVRIQLLYRQSCFKESNLKLSIEKDGLSITTNYNCMSHKQAKIVLSQSSCLVLSIKYTSMLSVAKSTKDKHNIYSLIIFLSNPVNQQQQEEYEEDDEEETTEAILVANLNNIQLNKQQPTTQKLQLCGQFTLTISMYSQKQSELSSNIEQSVANESSKIKAIEICDKIYEGLIQKLNQIDKEKSAYNNNMIRQMISPASDEECQFQQGGGDQQINL